MSKVIDALKAMSAGLLATAKPQGLVSAELDEIIRIVDPLHGRTEADVLAYQEGQAARLLQLETEYKAVQAEVKTAIATRAESGRHAEDVEHAEDFERDGGALGSAERALAFARTQLDATAVKA